MDSAPDHLDISDEIIEKALRFDPLAEAEKITGVSYKEDEATTALGFGFAMAHSKAKQQILSDAGDTHNGVTWADFKSLLALEGFEIVRTETFPYRDHDGTTDMPEQIIAWHPQGVLVVADEWMGYGDRQPTINSANMYYAWKPSSRDNHWDFTSSGGFETMDDRKPWGDEVPFEDLIWAGYHDIREGFRYKLRRLRDNGAFVTPWPKRSWLWLLHYNDTKVKDYDYQKINARKILDLPKHVQQALNREEA